MMQCIQSCFGFDVSVHPSLVPPRSIKVVHVDALNPHRLSQDAVAPPSIGFCARIDSLHYVETLSSRHCGEPPLCCQRLGHQLLSSVDPWCGRLGPALDADHQASRKVGLQCQSVHLQGISQCQGLRRQGRYVTLSAARLSFKLLITV